MKKQRQYFPSQRDSEEVFLLLRRHWFTYIPLLLIVAFMLIPLVILIIYWYYNLNNINGSINILIIITGSIYALVSLSLLLFGFIDFYLDVDIITNQRIVDIEQNGFFRRKISELSLEQIEDVSASVDGVFPTLLHFGDLHIQTAGTLPNFVFASIPHPYRISKIILELQDATRSKSAQKREKILAEISKMPGSLIGDKDRSAVIARSFDSDSFYSPVAHLTKQKQKQILSGLKNDIKKAKTNANIVLEGELKEGREVDL